MAYVDFKCEATNASVVLDHFWEHTVGSCHATMALRADWQKQLCRCHRELGFMHVRFHGFLSDDMGMFTRSSMQTRCVIFCFP